jgi:hypothetical protein
MLEGRCLLSAFPVLNFLDSGPGSLREAILAANSEPGADLISFAPAARDGSIALTGGQLNITDDLTIDGPGANHLTVSGNNSSRVFSISGGTTDVELSGLTIADGMATGTTVVGPSGSVTMGGGILNSGGNLTVSQVTLSNNRVVGFNGAGGAIASVLGATLSVEHGTFTGNRATGSNFGFGGGTGGGIFSDAGSTLIVAHSTFTGNQGIGSDGSAGRGGVGRGGAIDNRGSRATVSYSVFADNLASSGRGANGGPGQNGSLGGDAVGGAITNYDGSLLGPSAPAIMSVAHCAFTGNRALAGTGGNGGLGGNGGNGGMGIAGAIQNRGQGTAVLISDSTFTGNQALAGAGGSGGVGGNGGNGGDAPGGTITNASANLGVQNSRFTDNQASGGAGGSGGVGGNGGAGGNGTGGAINSRPAAPSPTILSTLTADRLTVDDNRTIGGAGGNRGVGGLRGGNGGAGMAGGIGNGFGGTGTISYATFIRNQATGGAGGLGGNGGVGQGGGIGVGPPNPVTSAPTTLTLLHSTIVNNRADGGAAGVGGIAGSGQGGGITNLSGGILYVDQFTNITGNHASTNDDDVFGVLTFI